MTRAAASLAEPIRGARFQRAGHDAAMPHFHHARHVGNVPYGRAASAMAGLVILLAFAPAARAGAGEAAEEVRQGVSHFQAKDYQQASKDFAEADVSRPDDPWIAYDRACACAALGDADKAAKLFEQAALSRDRGLAAGSHYNLGVMAAEKARALFGKKPEEAPPQARAQGVALLTEAVKHYRDCLDLDPDHADARHNLELIRLWVKHMEELWRQRDRQKARKEKGLLEFLRMIEARQRELRSATKTLAGQADSPRRRQVLSTTESAQRELAEEIGPLKEKIKAELGSAQKAGQSPHGAPGSPPAPSVSPGAAQTAIQGLTRWADEAGKAMTQAADELRDGSPGDAVAPQTEAVEKLDQIYRAVVPFPQLVQRAITTEQGLVDQVAPAAENPKEAGKPKEKDQLDFDDAAWNQRLLAGWADVLAPKAEQGLKGLEQLDPSTLTAPPQGGSQPAGPNPQKQPKPDAEAMKKQLEGLKQSMKKAVELGPRVHDLAVEAAKQLADKHAAAALPKQQEALKLLKETAEPLPKQKQQQQQKDQGQKKRGDQKKNQQQSDQGRKQKEGKQEKSKPQDLSRRRAEAVIRKVRQRQRERRELTKQLQRQIYRPGAVEKDW
jgi:hypothetical protein